MAHGYTGSRSPVRAISAATHPTWAGPVPRPRTWSEPDVQEIIPRAPLASPSPEGVALACPDCGSRVHLALVPTSPEEATGAHSPGAASALRSAPEPELMSSFEDSILRHKRELITRALEETDGVMTRAARALGLKYTTFVAMTHRLGIPASNGEQGEAK